MIIDMGSVEGLGALLDRKTEKSALSAWLALLPLEVAAVEALLAVELVSLVEEAW